MLLSAGATVTGAPATSAIGLQFGVIFSETHIVPCQVIMLLKKALAKVFPAPTPCALPALFTVTTAVLLLLQELGVRVCVVPYESVAWAINAIWLNEIWCAG